MINTFSKLFTLVLLVIIGIVCATTLMITNSITSGRKLIYIDPGHGGPDGGAVGIDGLFEKEIVLNVSKKLSDFLSKAGYRVLLTRNGDYDLAPDSSRNRKRDDIHKRVRLISSSDAILYVSVHANKFGSPNVYGAQVFYKENDPVSQALSEEIQDAIRSVLQNTKRLAKPIAGKYLVDNCTKTGCIVEIGFLSNPKDAAFLQSDIYQEKMAFAIYLGICSFLAKN